jgi:hypothetical protein
MFDVHLLLLFFEWDRWVIPQICGQRMETAGRGVNRE